MVCCRVTSSLLAACAFTQGQVSSHQLSDYSSCGSIGEVGYELVSGSTPGCLQL